jgi:hypothetical protein
VSILLTSVGLEEPGGHDTLALTFRAGKAKAKKRKQKGRSEGKGHWDPAPRGGRVVHVVPSTKDDPVLRTIVLNAVHEALR